MTFWNTSIIASLALGFVLPLHAQAPKTTPDGFALPQPHRQFSFPRDHGSHPEFRTEWWYITGHLSTADGRRFGFQSTFFRQASPNNEALFLAHTALLDVKNRRFINEERLNREGWDAEASTQVLDVHNGNWSLKMEGNTLHLAASVSNEAGLAFTLTPTKPLAIFGKDGVSQKGSSAGAASHYLTFPRLDCQGTIRLGEGELHVSGEAWLDHEFSSSQLDEGQTGWDWASIQLKDGRDAMVYRMRRTDGSNDPAGTTLAWVAKDGTITQSDAKSFEWRVLKTWTSPQSKAQYPIQAEIRAGNEVLRLVPLVEAQELTGAVTGLPYWEGACDVTDANGLIIGRAYLELAGYAGDLARHLRGSERKPGG